MTDVKPKLLIVDDDTGIQRQLRWSFDDYDVSFAVDRESAMAQFRAERPPVVTLDLGLPPDEDGALAPAWEFRFSSTSNTAFPVAGDTFLFSPLWTPPVWR